MRDKAIADSSPACTQSTTMMPFPMPFCVRLLISASIFALRGAIPYEHQRIVWADTGT